MNKKLLLFAAIGIIGVGVPLFFILAQNDKPELYPVSSEGANPTMEKDLPTPQNPGSSPSQATEDKTDAGQPENKMNTSHLITLKTNLGDITFKTYDADAPKTVENFLTLAGKGFYDGVIFHRVIDKFMIQGGDPTGTGRGGPGYSFADELNPNTDSYKKGYVKGTVAMANAGPNTNGSQFFIMVADVPLPHDYTIFGSVVSGQDVADKISLVPRDRSDRPLSPVTINKVVVTEE